MPISGIHNGWHFDPENARLDIYYRGTRVGSVDANSMDLVQALGVTGGITAVTGAIVATVGAITATAGDINVTAANLRLGAVSAFATTEPTSAVVMKQGTAFAGAITTSSGIMSNGTLLRKIIADGTVSNVG